MVIFLILRITNGGNQWYNPFGEMGEHQLTDIFIDLILNGIKEE